MRDYRAPKGWIHMGTNDMSFGNTETKQERIRREQKFNNAIRNIKPMNFEFDMNKGEINPTGLKKEGDAAALAKKNRKTNLVAAFEDKKLKSKSLIREAQTYIKEDNQKKTKAK